MESFENLPGPDAVWRSGPRGPDRHPVSEPPPPPLWQMPFKIAIFLESSHRTCLFVLSEDIRMTVKTKK